jgi:hypothetical protein
MLLVPKFLNSQLQNYYAFQSKIRNPKSKIERHLKPNFGTGGPTYVSKEPIAS